MPPVSWIWRKTRNVRTRSRLPARALATPPARPTFAAIAAILACALLLAGCGDGPAARPTLSATATPPGDARTVYVGADGVYALRPSDGAVRWTYAAGPHAAAVVADTVAGGAVVATLEDGSVVALDARRGAVRWRHQEAGRRFGMPLATGDAVYATFYRAGLATPLTDSVAALDARDGALRWQFQTGGNLLAAPTFADGVLYVGSTDTSLYALRASDGALLWRHQLFNPGGGGISPRAAEADGLVYIGAGVLAGPGPGAPWRNYVAALRASDGTEVWRYQVDTASEGSVKGPVAVGGGVVYASTRNGDGDALDARTGALAWRAHVDQADFSAPTLAGGVLYLEASIDPRVETGEVYALSPRDGAILWRAPTSSRNVRVAPAPAVADGAVYAAACDCQQINPVPDPPGALGAYDAAAGAARWSYKTRLLPLAIAVGGP